MSLGPHDHQAFNHHELETFNHQEARFHHDSFMDSLTIGRTRTSTILVLTGLLFLSLAITLSGIIFTVIFTDHGNYNAAVWAFFSGAVSLGTSSLFILHLRMKLEKWHDWRTLEGIKLFGMIISIMSGIALGINLILGFLDKWSFRLEGNNYFSSAAFSGLSLSSSLFLYFVSQWYQNAVEVFMAREAVNRQRIIGDHTNSR